MATIQKVLTVGATFPVLALIGTKGRAGWRVTMPSTAIEAGNTGRIHLGRNYAPNNVLGDPAQGDVLISSGEIKEAKTHKEDTIFEGDIWLFASAAGQRAYVEETIP